MKTCLRLLHFASLDESQAPPYLDEYQILQGQDAYQLVLEIICGLHSPVIGETEVFGQFKKFRQAQEYPYPLRQVFDQLIVDAKKVRGRYLTDLGGQSYGSLIRKMLQSPTQVAMVGAGQFAQDILPWIYKDENHLSVYARQPVKASELKTKFPRLNVGDLQQDKINTPVVIIAAPVKSEELEALITDKNALVIDLRAESAQDPCRCFKNYKTLQDFFTTIEKNQSQILIAKAQSLAAIRDLSLQRFFTESLRPFGWDDICAW